MLDVDFFRMNILALDLGSKTGFAILKDGQITIGTKKLSHDRRASGVRALDFYRWLTQTIREHGIGRVYFERVYRHSGVEAAHLYGYFMHMLAAVCEEHGIRCAGIPVTTIKKFATGKGNASKEEMIAAARSRGFNPVDDNSADALAILLAGLNALNSQQSCGSCFAMEASGAQAPITSPASELFQRLTQQHLKYESK
jgi:Holliday junction resolvasome RuvABC endonuclease subunit